MTTHDNDKETTLGELLKELETDLGLDRMNQATRLLYDLLMENPDGLDGYPDGHDEMMHMTLDGHEYLVACDPQVEEAPALEAASGIFDLRVTPMHEGTKLLHEVLEENDDRIDGASLLDDGTLSMSLHGQLYRVTCDRIVRDGDMIVIEGPRPSEGRGVFDNSRLHLVHADDSEEARDLSCAVTIQSDHISVRYADELEDGSPITVTYRGWDHCVGHFELRFELRDEHGTVGQGRATLHRLTPRSQQLEGFWKEVWGSDESRGAWQIELKE